MAKVAPSLFHRLQATSYTSRHTPHVTRHKKPVILGLDCKGMSEGGDGATGGGEERICQRDDGEKEEEEEEEEEERERGLRA